MNEQIKRYKEVINTVSVQQRIFKRELKHHQRVQRQFLKDHKCWSSLDYLVEHGDGLRVTSCEGLQSYIDITRNQLRRLNEWRVGERELSDVDKLFEYVLWLVDVSQKYLDSCREFERKIKDL